MACCEKCWRDAFTRSCNDPFKSQTEAYLELLKEREDNPCTIEEQEGKDEEDNQ